MLPSFPHRAREVVVVLDVQQRVVQLAVPGPPPAHRGRLPGAPHGAALAVGAVGAAWEARERAARVALALVSAPALLAARFSPRLVVLVV